MYLGVSKRSLLLFREYKSEGTINQQPAIKFPSSYSLTTNHALSHQHTVQMKQTEKLFA